MNKILEKLNTKERDIFKQIINLYDEKKYKKAMKLVEKMKAMNCEIQGYIIRNRSYTCPSPKPHWKYRR